MSKFFEFSQNNSGGRFTIDDARGLGPRVWIEADDTIHANYRAGRLGIYFNGCADGRDCSCCGDRWDEAWGDGEDAPDINHEYDFNWHDAVYVHRLDGSIERIRHSHANSLP
jgi:hypothetical protein